MSQTLKWKFADNQDGAVQGPNHPGIANFAGDREIAIIREAIQNSLDAREGERPVSVIFERKTLDKNILAADDLLQHIEWSIDSPHNDDDNKTTFKNAKSLLRGGGGIVVCLCITDSNTTGAVDAGDNPTHWTALTKGSGFPRKAIKNAAGAFGIGKFASFASTDLRTVLYSTAFQNNGKLEHRFQGKTILVSHEDGCGKSLQNIGYLGNNFDPLKNQELPDPIKLEESGTSLYIPYYRFGKVKKWLHDSTQIVLENFFYAIINGNLRVEFRDTFSDSGFPNRVIDKKTCSKYHQEIPHDSSTNRFMRLATREPDAKEDFRDVGSISIRISVDPNTRRREFALVRDSGMLIISDKSDSKCKLPGLKRFPSHWSGFTAVIDCQSKGQGLLRQAESPGHDCISEDYIRDTDMRADVTDIFKVIGNWCSERIRDLAEPESGGTSVNPYEIASFIPLLGDSNLQPDQNGSDEQGEPVVTPPVKDTKPPRYNPVSPKPVPPKPIPPKPIPPKPIPPKPPKPQVVPQKFISIRFTPGSSPTHSVKVTFDRPDGSPTGIELWAIGEDGKRYSIGVRKAFFEGQSLDVRNDLVTLPDTDQERQGIEIITRDPVQNKSFNLRFMGSAQ